MRIKLVRLKNFRGVSDGVVHFRGHTLLLGANNVGKSTVLEALDFALRPGAVRNPDLLCEHDFHFGEYEAATTDFEESAEPDENAEPDDEIVEVEQAAEDSGGDENGVNDDLVSDAEESSEEPNFPTIEIEVVFDSLTDDEQARFRKHLEIWDEANDAPFQDSDDIPEDPNTSEIVLRTCLRGRYVPEDDEFDAQTFFMHPSDEHGDLERLSRSHKKAIGFLYLRSLRTGRRAASMERGSLLDLLLSLHDARPRVWKEVMGQLHELGDVLDEDENFREALDVLNGYFESYSTLVEGQGTSNQLFVSRLTRRHLREVAVLFLASSAGGFLLPFDRLGSGAQNTLVLSLLRAIAAEKENVIFAMEEPETALGPHTQRRIVDDLKRSTQQAIVTSHSPYVTERFLPDGILVLRREEGVLTANGLEDANPLKEKTLRRDFRHRFAEGLVGVAVLVVEGLTELYALPAASDLLAETDSDYLSFDLEGVTVVPSDGDGALAKFAGFFGHLGIPAFVVSDSVDEDTRSKINAVATRYWELDYKGFERVLTDQLPVDELRAFSNRLEEAGDMPVQKPDADASDEEWREWATEVLKKRKGEGYAALLVEQAGATNLPDDLTSILRQIHANLSGADGDGD